jgi:hypothetical protein
MKVKIPPCCLTTRPAGRVKNCKEYNFKRRLANKAVPLGYKVFKFPQSGTFLIGLKGLPDLFLVNRNGGHVWIELKTGYLQPTIEQLETHQLLRLAGMHVCVLWPHSDIDSVLEAHIYPTKTFK